MQADSTSVQPCSNEFSNVEREESVKMSDDGDNLPPEQAEGQEEPIQTCNHINIGEKLGQISEKSDNSPLVQSDSRQAPLVCSDNPLNIEEKEKSISWHQGESLVQADSTQVLQNKTETLFGSTPGVIAAKTLLQSLDTNSSEAFVILKVSKGDGEKNLPLTEESNVKSREGKVINNLKITVQDSEILWCLFCVRYELPYSTFNTIDFQKMFPNSSSAHLIANTNSEKLAYIVSKGLQMYFRRKLLCYLENNEYCVVVFKEHFYINNGYRQIDLHIRFWNFDTDEVQMSYLTSIFIKFCSNPQNEVEEKIWESLKDLKDCRIIQLCLDGSPINLHCLSFLQKKVEKHFVYGITDINNSLNSLYEAFENGAEASEWKLDDILRSLYLLFKDSPQLCIEYIKVTKCSVLPLPFHNKLLLNIETAERAFEIWIYIKRYLNFIKSEYQYLINSNYFTIIKEAVDDVLMPIKLKFFISIGRQMEKLINLFKSDKPMLPFFYKELKEFRNRCKNYYRGKHYSFSDLTTVDKVDFECNNNSNSILSDVHLGFSGEKILKEISQKRVSIIQEVLLKAAAQEFVVTLDKMLLQNSYLNNSLFESLSCLDPLNMICNTEDCVNKFTHILSVFMETNHLYENTCEELKHQFVMFLDDAVLCHKTDFKAFDHTNNECRLDTFLYNYLCYDKFKELWHFIKGLLLLFNGQVDSTELNPLNEDDSFEESQKDYIARRFISVHLKDGTDVVVTDEMRQLVNEVIQNVDLDTDTNGLES